MLKWFKITKCLTKPLILLDYISIDNFCYLQCISNTFTLVELFLNFPRNYYI